MDNLIPNLWNQRWFSLGAGPFAQLNPLYTLEVCDLRVQAREEMTMPPPLSCRYFLLPWRMLMGYIHLRRLHVPLSPPGLPSFRDRIHQEPYQYHRIIQIEQLLTSLGMPALEKTVLRRRRGQWWGDPKEDAFGPPGLGPVMPK